MLSPGFDCFRHMLMYRITCYCHISYLCGVLMTEMGLLVYSNCILICYWQTYLAVMSHTGPVTCFFLLIEWL